MPKFKSINGVWYPVTKTARKMLNVAGLETFGAKVKDSTLAVEALIENKNIPEKEVDEEELEIEEKEDVVKIEKKKIRFKPGVARKKRKIVSQ